MGEAFSPAARVLVLTSSTGGGHDMRARAFKAWAERSGMEPLRFRVEIMQALETAHPLYRFGVDLYNRIQRFCPALHHIYFHYLDLVAMHRNADALMGVEAYIQKLDTFRPHLILSTHGHLNHGFFSLARNRLGRPSLRCATYCGELHGGYGFSHHWVNPRADLFLGAVAETCDEADRLGMPPGQNALGGFLLQPLFFEEPISGELDSFWQETIGLDRRRFTVILSTGANSAVNHLSFLESLERAGMRLQVVALCGRNEVAHDEITQWSRSAQRVDVRALPRLERMDLLLRGASVLVARPGTGTTSEAIQTGCPIIFNCLGGIMPQERITVAYAHKHRFGPVMYRPRDLVPYLRRWQEDRFEYAREKAALAMARPRKHPRDILLALADLAGEAMV